MRQRRSLGQSLEEFALILPLLLLLVFGIIEFGRVMNAYLACTNGAREGARAAAVGANQTVVRNTVIAAVPSLGLAPGDITITGAVGASGNMVTVRVNYELPMVAPIISAILPNPFPVAGEAIMRVE